ncbi:UTP--glucose-1-phosphate uridylyltransferase GalU [archaeon]|nr:UTP--glucose-1-phosphate uridylyltransferase GalU [archaeon]
MKAVIPAAGYGTRFLPATKAQPKEMLPVYDKPTIQYVVEEAVASGIDDILIIIGRGKRAIEDHFDRSIELELSLKNSQKDEYLKEIIDISELADIHFIRQKEQKGLGDAVYTARKYVGDEPFCVLLGDTVTVSETPCTKQLIDIYNKHQGSVIAVEKVKKEEIERYGIVKGESIDGVLKITGVVEKPKFEDAPSDLGIIGRYLLTPEIFDCIKKTKRGSGGEIQLTDGIGLLKDMQDVYAYEFKGKRYDIGTKLDWLKSSIEIALQRDDIGDELLDYLKELTKSK